MQNSGIEPALTFKIPPMDPSRFPTGLFTFAVASLSLSALPLLGTASAADSGLVDPRAVAKAFPPQTPATPEASFKTKKGPYKIAFSNSYFGNNWRAEMLKAADAYV